MVVVGLTASLAAFVVVLIAKVVETCTAGDVADEATDEATDEDADEATGFLGGVAPVLALVHVPPVHLVYREIAPAAPQNSSALPAHGIVHLPATPGMGFAALGRLLPPTSS